MTDEIFTLSHDILIAIFAIGYTAIILEFLIRVNKTAVALFMAVVCWLIYFVGDPQPLSVSTAFLNTHLSDVSQILFFLLGAMTMVELIDSHKGFNTFIHYLHTRSKRKMLWVTCFLAFFLSAVLDNLTTTILMISILRKLIPHKKERFLFSCMVIVAANAGGAWTPIGDVTTTMLWIGGQITSMKVITELFFPSLISMMFPLLLYTFTMKGKFPKSEIDFRDEPLEPGAHLVFYLGIVLFLCVPVFKALTGLPPFMGMLISLSIMWLATDIMHHRYEQRHHLRVPHILTKIDVSSILFFLGILLSVNALESTGLLDGAAQWLNVNMRSEALIASVIGVVSAIIDNVPLVAATMGMYDLQTTPTDSPLWLMIAYAAGTGGSILVMGSSAGVALMGLEKVDFFSYFKKMSLPVFIGYVLGMLFYVFLF
ncbi:sodium:proton antiporter NhaD [Candidatus Neptunichlamydia sp. REUL1]|uniref:sodium:proton antiporter NhaD n=1 Tax=Candidatus Neptunichlamydia sp. REUL1 TaxID=3064277 RepID=UPI002930DEA7|nr:sodium:proton antiporter NhaD [Candidatus Neptunochlamydia sp. REUL1]